MQQFQLFSSLLTGNKANHPVIAPINNPNQAANSQNNYDLINTGFYISRDYSIRRIPTYLMTQRDYRKLNHFKPFIYTKLSKHNDYQLFVSMPVHAIELLYNPYRYPRQLEHVNIMYEPTIWLKYQDDSDFHRLTKPVKAQTSYVIKGFTTNPYNWLIDNLSKYAKHFDYLANFNQFWQNYDLANTLNQQADLFSNHLANLFNTYGTNQNWCQTILNNCANYDIPLSQYQAVYSVLNKLSITKHDYQQIVSTNEYLLLISNIEQLHHDQNKLPTVPNNPQFASGRYNLQQLTAITSPYRLNLLQSVAGSGKSTTILGRIKYLLNAHVKPENITVLSFTNAAADHIRNSIDSDIDSLTIAKMIHEIYQANFHHHLSNTDTLINSLYLTYGTNNLTVNEFVKHLNKIDSNAKQASTKALHFITQHENTIISMLNRINQTSLSLEEIFCYLHLSDWHNPYKTKYLIVDEVQDTSIFQFIFLLKYAVINQANVFFVGDASQTLYEFRNANPRALNAIEATNYFHAFRLETNYRSNSSILMYANQVLNHLTTNQFAHLKLRSFDPSELTLDQFNQQIHYYHLAKDKFTLGDLESLFSQNLKDYITDCLTQNQKVAVLTRSRKLALQTQIILSKLYPNKIVNNITKINPQSLTILSNYLRQYSPEIDFMPVTTLPNMLLIAIKDKLGTLWPKNLYQSQLDELLPEAQNLILIAMQSLKAKYNDWLKDYNAKKLTHQQIVDRVKKLLLDCEINYNQQLQDDLNTATSNTGKQIAQADLITSTMHGTKGLEFDNTIILFNNGRGLSQADQRLLYVAATRSKNSEVLVEASKNPGLIAQCYQNCLTKLI